MSESTDRDPLLPPAAARTRTYGILHPQDEEQGDSSGKNLSSSFGYENVRAKATLSSKDSSETTKTKQAAAASGTSGATSSNSNKTGPLRFVYYIIYALVNVIISAPGLYGYAAVIFNHPVFENHMNALSKLVIFSSLIHQLGFFLFSSLDFAIGTVQDAGLIFLSSMVRVLVIYLI
jgi:hypothetical protein